MEAGNSQRILFRESAVTWLLILAMVVVVSASFICRAPAEPPCFEEPLEPSLITVQISGAVQSPGHYSVPEGSKIQVLFDQAHPHPLADLSEYSKSTRLSPGQHIVLVKVQGMRITVTGEVQNPGRYEVPRNMRLCHLGKYVPLSNKADIALIRRSRRVLKSGEKLVVPAA